MVEVVTLTPGGADDDSTSGTVDVWTDDVGVEVSGLGGNETIAVTVAVLGGDAASLLACGAADESAGEVASSSAVFTSVTANASTRPTATMYITYEEVALGWPARQHDCTAPPLFGRRDDSRTCANGCCQGGVCVCNAGWFGVLCDFRHVCLRRELESGVVNATCDTSAYNWTHCNTARVEGGGIECRCARPGLALVVARHHLRLLPSLGVDLQEGTRRATAALLWPLGIAAVYTIAITLAGRADRRGVLYGVAPPWWLWPGAAGYTVARQILVNARTCAALLRWRYVMPGKRPDSSHPSLRRRPKHAN